jgi:hypothetical protein
VRESDQCIRSFLLGIGSFAPGPIWSSL